MKYISVLLILAILSFSATPQPIRAQDSSTGPYSLLLTLGAGMVRSTAWSPDGNVLAVGGALGIWLYTPGLEPITLLKGHTKAVYGLAFSPDGTQLASASHDMTVRVWDVTGQAQSPERLTLEGHTGLTVAVAWSPDGQTLATGSYDKTVRLWDAATGNLLRVLKGHSGGVNQVAFSADGSQVISSALNGEIRTWDAATGHPLDVIEGSAAEWSRLTGQPAETYLGGTPIQQERSLSPDGTLWAVVDWDGDVQIIDVATGELLGERAEHIDWIIWLGWDGDRLLSTALNGSEYSWDADSGDLLGVELVDPDDLPPVEPISADGTQSFTINEAGVTRILDAAGQVIAELPGKANTAAWNDDGTRLAVAQRNGTIQIWG